MSNKSPVSLTAVLGMAATALAMLIMVPGLLARAQGAPGARPTRAPVVAAFATPVPAAPGADAPAHPGPFAWLAGMFRPRPPVEEAPPADPLPDPARFDPQAASRVQSFSCETQLSNSRALICTRWDLATADYNLALLYRAALERVRDPRALRRAHAAWLKQLDRLGGDAARIQQHIEEFRQHLAES